MLCPFASRFTPNRLKIRTEDWWSEFTSLSRTRETIGISEDKQGHRAVALDNPLATAVPRGPSCVVCSSPSGLLAASAQVVLCFPQRRR